MLTTLWWIAVVIDGTGWICGHVLKKETVEKKDDWKWLFSVLLVVLFITWLMLAWSGKYVYPQGDDFEYGANSHLAWVHVKQWQMPFEAGREHFLLFFSWHFSQGSGENSIII